MALYLPGTTFQITTNLDALWYLPEWHDAIASWEATSNPTPGQTHAEQRDNPAPKPKPEDLPGPPTHHDLEVSKGTNSAAPVFALIVGINQYKYARTPSLNQDNLRGCVADANDFETFLNEILHVPACNITKLCDSEATATAILGALEGIATNNCIPKGSAIVIYYSGHGCRILAPEGWLANDNLISGIVPHDMYQDAADTVKNGLSDMKWRELLEGIAKEKGNNITVIFDSCYSGSGTRGPSTDTSVGIRRFIVPSGARLDKDAMPVVNLDKDELPVVSLSRGSMVSQTNQYKGLSSHVLLAACQETEHARENEYGHGWRGVFSVALLNLLRSENLKTLTYHDVIRSLPELPTQRPQCEGVNQDRILFNNQVATRRQILFEIEEQKPGSFLMHAGDAIGVTPNAEFAVFENKACVRELGRLVVETTDAFTSTLKLAQGTQRFAIPKNHTYFALQTRIGNIHDVCLLVELSGTLSAVFEVLRQEMQAKRDGKPSFKLASSPNDNPDLIVTPAQDRACFRLTDQFCRDQGLSEIPSRPLTDHETMTKVLRAIAHFYYHLRRSPASNPDVNVSSLAKIECHEMHQTEWDYTGGNLVTEEGRIYLEINDESPKDYTYTVYNNSHMELFVSMFYFNMSDFSINSYHTPPTARLPSDHVPCLPVNGKATFGFGTPGAEAVRYTLKSGQDVDIGYIKVFLTAQYVDYQDVKQESPFALDFRGSSPSPRRRSAWDAVLIPVIQRRSSVSIPKPVLLDFTSSNNPLYSPTNSTQSPTPLPPNGSNFCGLFPLSFRLWRWFGWWRRTAGTTGPTHNDGRL